MAAAWQNNLTQLCELERTEISAILSLTQINRFIAVYLLTGIRSSIDYHEGASLWLYEGQRHLSPFYTLKAKCFDKTFHQNTFFHIDPISRQNYFLPQEFLLMGYCANSIALDFKENDYSLLTPAPIIVDHPAPSKQPECRSALQPKKSQLTSPVFVCQNKLKISEIDFFKEKIQMKQYKS